jgi:hypothetical protein
MYESTLGDFIKWLQTLEPETETRITISNVGFDTEPERTRVKSQPLYIEISGLALVLD